LIEMRKIVVVFGTRPEIIKLAELIRLLKADKSVETLLVYTGQHYDKNLCEVFLQELELPRIDASLGIHGGTNVGQIARMLESLFGLFEEERPDFVVAEGDTNSVVAAAMASYYAGARFAHVEAGLRSFDERLPEEANRIIADNLSHYAFAPTETALKNLEKTSCREGGAFLTGNTIVEAVQKNLEKASNSKILERLGLEKEKYAVLTAHRQEYVDKKENLEALLSAVEEIPIKVVFPAHPRTLKNLERLGLMERVKSVKNLLFVGPLGYFDFLWLASNSMFLLSDSGGVSEEVTVYKKWLLVLRDKPDRPEMLKEFGKLVGYDKEKIAAEAKGIIGNYGEVKKRLAGVESPFGDGKASERIAGILLGEKQE
jgi:UDP-N-acetylglucosamine 2-epimerase (non-hydrolysing)